MSLIAIIGGPKLGADPSLRELQTACSVHHARAMEQMTLWQNYGFFFNWLEGGDAAPLKHPGGGVILKGWDLVHLFTPVGPARFGRDLQGDVLVRLFHNPRGIMEQVQHTRVGGLFIAGPIGACEGHDATVPSYPVLPVALPGGGRGIWEIPQTPDVLLAQGNSLWNTVNTLGYVHPGAQRDGWINFDNAAVQDRLLRVGGVPVPQGAAPDAAEDVRGDG